MSSINDHYHKEYTKDFASRWDDLIDWNGRRKGERQFFEKLLDQHEVETVADVASGTGYHAITLAQADFEVYATDGARNMVAQTRANAREHDVELADVRQVDWRELHDVYGSNRFDALLCLGNAFTHLFEHDARVEALEAMHDVLKPNGLLAVDQRNYDYILSDGYSSKHAYYYTGKEVEAYPVEISDEAVVFEYQYADGDTFHLRLFPLRQDYVTELVTDVGFDDVRRFGDFQHPYDDDVDFIQHIAFKRENS
jgi:ubiquinone/menaquinone biosynthesis C-methylase UbiE